MPFKRPATSASFLITTRVVFGLRLIWLRQVSWLRRQTFQSAFPVNFTGGLMLLKVAVTVAGLRRFFTVFPFTPTSGGTPQRFE